MKAYEINHQVAKYYTKKRACVNFEVGLCRRGRLRGDVVALQMSGLITIVEVKSSPADFKSDRKWELYREFCHKFYFAMTPETFERIDFPANVGLMLVTVNKVVVKQPSRTEAMYSDTHSNLIIRMAFRSSDYNRYRRTNP